MIVTTMKVVSMMAGTVVETLRTTGISIVLYASALILHMIQVQQQP